MTGVELRLRADLAQLKPAAFTKRLFSCRILLRWISQNFVLAVHFWQLIWNYCRFLNEFRS